MGINYYWEIGPLNVKINENGFANVVYVVNWRLVASEVNYSANIYGAAPIKKPSNDNFTPFELLTKQQVQKWLEDEIGNEQINAYKAILQKQIELQKNPIDATLNPPWEQL